MNYVTIKKLYEGLPYVIKAPFSGILRKKLIGNSVFIKYFNRLQESEKWTDERIAQEQFDLYKDTLVHAYEHTKYYRELFDSVGINPYDITSFESISKIPVLTKKILQERFADLIADDAGEGYLVTTGGTSGEPTKVMMSNDAYYIEWAFVYSFWGKYGYDIQSSKLATFRGIKLGEKYNEINPMYREIRMNVFSMGRNNIDKYVKAIRDYGADFIFGYPSAIYNFCKLTQEARIPVSGMFKAALLISENLYPFQEEKIQEVLGCPIGMFYGHSERAVFAGRFQQGYSFNSLYGVTEISENGEPIVTGFINRKTPLIRYLVDDHITEIDGCNANIDQHGIVIPNHNYAILGHHDAEVLYGNNGQEIAAAAINFHDKTFDNVIAYQFLQDEKGKCTLCIVPNQNFQDDGIASIKKSVEEKFGRALQCEIKVKKQIQLTERGKYKMIIQSPELFDKQRKQ